MRRTNLSLTVTCHTDSDWAGCSQTRKSTSGVLCSVLRTAISALSRTQQTLALSSGAAELYAVFLGVAESLFLKSLILEAGFAKTCTVTSFTDSTAGKSMSNRWGTTRRSKHIDLRFLFVQELIVVEEVFGTLHPAYILTKNVSKETLHRHLSQAGLFDRPSSSRPTDRLVHAITFHSRVCSILLERTKERGETLCLSRKSRDFLCFAVVFVFGV